MVMHPISLDIPNRHLHQVLEEIAQGYQDTYSAFIGLVLFGSHARGTAEGDSDIDIGLIIDKSVDYIDPDSITMDLRKRLDSVGYKLCSHNNPASLTLDIGQSYPETVDELQRRSHVLDKVTLVQGEKLDLTHYVLFELKKFWLPFGLVYGDHEGIVRSQQFAETVFNQSNNPQKYRKQISLLKDWSY